MCTGQNKTTWRWPHVHAHRQVPESALGLNPTRRCDSISADRCQLHVLAPCITICCPSLELHHARAPGQTPALQLPLKQFIGWYMPIHSVLAIAAFGSWSLGSACGLNKPCPACRCASLKLQASQIAHTPPAHGCVCLCSCMWMMPCSPVV